MAYVTLSTWKLNSSVEDKDAMWRVIQEKYAPASKAMGASNAMWVETGDDESMIVTIFPDKAASDAADKKRAELRSQGSSEFDVTMTSELRGEVKAST